MRRHLNTVYVATDDSYIRKDGANLVVSQDGAEIGRAPIHMLGGLVCFGRVGLSSPVIAYCAELGVTVTLLSSFGKFQARVEGPVSGNVLLRRAQYRASDDPKASAELVRSIVAAKIFNQRAVLRRALRDHADKYSEERKSAIGRVERKLTDIARRCRKPSDVDTLRGYEGESARAYFSVFADLILAQKDAFAFLGRTRRPPRDPVNALLSLLYVLLTHDCRSALESVGLDPAVGFLHKDRPGRPSLALDLAEEFRAFIADRLTLSFINRRQVSENDFRFMENGAVLIKDEPRKQILAAYQERKRDELSHPYLEEKTTIGLLWFIQAQLLARCLRGDLDAYPPFLMR
ncbi:MAG: type I-C CRISPR-associated endonuclease Cas1c [Parvularculaceae bacterium]